MSFRKLEICGFKSFADKLEVKFDDGVTAIVGPNGCGKSNVADAMRWVMGEQRSRLLRCSKMSEIIFGGTEKRKSLSYCEVSIHFDNTKRIFAIEYDDVVITRKIYRDDTSDYFINNSMCRLADIQNLLRDSGLGRDGYAIIGQGKIDEILSAKPEDRRAIFEEAAGISKFKARKAESERKLARTRDNLARISDIVLELERQLGPLSKQAENARKYLELKERLKHNEINLYIHKYDSASDAKKRVQSKLDGINQEIAQKIEEYERSKRLYEDCLSQINDWDNKIRAQNEQLMVASVAVEKQAGEHRLLIERQNHLSLENERLKNEIARLNQEFELSTSELNYLSDKRNDKEEKFERLSAELNAISAEYYELAERLALGEGAQEESNLKILEAADKLGDIKSELTRLLTEKDALTTKKAELGAKILAVGQRLSGDITNAEEHEKLIANAKKEKAKRQQKSDSLASEYNEALASIQRISAEAEELNGTLQYLTAQYNMFERIIKEYAGYQNSVKKLLIDAEKGLLPSKYIEGVVAQKIKVPEKIETAIETALGNALQNIITRTDADAKILVEYLKENRYGRASFLPMNTTKPRSLERAYRVLLGRRGILGVADELIEFNPQYKNVFSHLLGSTVIVETLNDAARLATEAQYGFRIVTLDGDIYSSGGTISGGSRREENTYMLSHEREIKSISQSLETKRAAQKEREKQKQEMQGIAGSINEELRGLVELMHNDDLLIATLTEKFNKLSGEISELEEENFELCQEELRTTQRLELICKDLEKIEQFENLLKSQKSSESENRQSSLQEYELMRKKLKALSDKMSDKRVEVASTNAETVALSSDLERVRARIIGLGESIDLSNELLEANGVAIKQNAAQRYEFEERLSRAANPEIERLKTLLANSHSFKDTLSQDLVKFNAENVRLGEVLTHLNEAKTNEEYLLRKVDEDIADMQERIEEEYALTYQMCIPFKDDEFDMAAAIQEIGKLRRQIIGLGDVYVNAIEECRAVGERYTQKNADREDLLKAESDLVKLIEQLEREALDRFNTEFTKISENFKGVFREMFNGGNARLELMESENPLEAGIEIMAEPPGKKLASIAPLSGGEKALIAIAILFSILKLKPMPFCVLDEIEAALDDSNAQRFAKYLKNFSKQTQFIVITHRKPTMELADNLYGVTMEEKGVSKIISVKLSDALNSAEVI